MIEVCRKLEYSSGATWEKVTIRDIVDSCDESELRSIRATINGKISKRKITPEQQEAMQKGRKRKGT
jgi:hypothetical protein